MKNIAIICGGYSGEYQVSIESAATVRRNIDKDKYNPYIVYIEKDKWFHKDEEGIEHYVNRNDFSLLIRNMPIKFDGVFNAIHGSPGEDGKILAFFDTIGIPYTSCDMDLSALTFNKHHCNHFLASLGIKVARSVSFLKGEHIDKASVIDGLGLPLFVKPARSGSSVGVSKVKTEEDFDNALEVAINIDERIIIEEFLDGREFGCGLFMSDKELKVLPLTEIIAKNDFFDFEAKYSGSMADEITPPGKLKSDAEIDIKATSAMIYRKLGCKGIIRIDYMLTGTDLYLIEINTVPGLSPASIIPKQAEAMGISLKELFSAVIRPMFRDGNP